MASHFVVFEKKSVIEHLFVDLSGVRVGRGFEGDGGGLGWIWDDIFWSVYRGGCWGRLRKTGIPGRSVYPPGSLHIRKPVNGNDKYLFVIVDS